MANLVADFDEIELKLINEEDQKIAIERFYQILKNIREIHAEDVAVLRKNILDRRQSETTNFLNFFENLFLYRSKILNMDYCLHIFSDSLSMPREAEGVSREDTYPFLLMQKMNKLSIDFTLNVNAKRARSTHHLNEEIFQILSKNYFAKKHIFILNLGIVDCTPRILLEFDAGIVLKNYGRLAYNTLIRISKNHKKILESASGSRVYVEPADFLIFIGNIVREIFNVYPNSKIFLVEILNSKVDKRNNYDENIDHYNNMIRSFSSDKVGVISVRGIEGVEGAFLEDGYHFSAVGNQMMADKIWDEIACLF